MADLGFNDELFDQKLAGFVDHAIGVSDTFSTSARGHFPPSAGGRVMTTMDDQVNQFTADALAAAETVLGVIPKLVDQDSGAINLLAQILDNAEQSTTDNVHGAFDGGRF
jgi:hypothetical protein